MSVRSFRETQAYVLSAQLKPEWGISIARNLTISATLNSDQWPDYKDGNEDEEKVKIMVMGSFLAIIQSFENMLSLHRLAKTEQNSFVEMDSQ
jgi:hypothetical protein